MFSYFAVRLLVYLAWEGHTHVGEVRSTCQSNMLTCRGTYLTMEMANITPIAIRSTMIRIPGTYMLEDAIEVAKAIPNIIRIKVLRPVSVSGTYTGSRGGISIPRLETAPFFPAAWLSRGPSIGPVTYGKASNTAPQI